MSFGGLSGGVFCLFEGFVYLFDFGFCLFVLGSLFVLFLLVVVGFFCFSNFSFLFLIPGDCFVFLNDHLSLHLTNKATKCLRQESFCGFLDIAPGVQVT